jgi:hypothetical protein
MIDDEHVNGIREFVGLTIVQSLVPHGSKPGRVVVAPDVFWLVKVRQDKALSVIGHTIVGDLPKDLLLVLCANPSTRTACTSVPMQCCKYV